MRRVKKPPWNLWAFEQPNESDDCRSVTDAIRLISNELKRLNQSDQLQSQVFRHQLALRLHDKLAEITDLAAGKLVFTSTETWRTVYQQVLESATVDARAEAQTLFVHRASLTQISTHNGSKSTRKQRKGKARVK